MTKNIAVAAVFMLLLLMVGCQPRGDLADRTTEVIGILAANDLSRLSPYIHPLKGVRFSAYAYIDLKTDRLLSAHELGAVWLKGSVHNWGFEDASGEPIQLSLKEFFQRFIYDVDFAYAEQIAYDQILGRGPTANNLAEVYPDGRFVEYHFSGFDPQLEGMDWKSLRLVFEQLDGAWYLVGIVHDQWTI